MINRQINLKNNQVIMVNNINNNNNNGNQINKSNTEMDAPPFEVEHN